MSFRSLFVSNQPPQPPGNSQPPARPPQSYGQPYPSLTARGTASPRTRRRPRRLPEHPRANARIEQEAAFVRTLLAEIGKVIVGQEPLVERLLIGLLAGGHVLLEGVPGLAKTLTVRTLADAHRASTSPASSSRPTCCRPTSSAPQIYNPQHRRLHRPARARSSPTSSWPTRSTAPPPRCSPPCSRPCRSARSPSATRPTRCPQPFLVLATQNPIEQEGTYPLPEAQVDRFMLKVKVDYPTRDEERRSSTA